VIISLSRSAGPKPAMIPPIDSSKVCLDIAASSGCMRRTRYTSIIL
jgi:hypothetical protein